MAKKNQSYLSGTRGLMLRLEIPVAAKWTSRIRQRVRYSSWSFIVVLKLPISFDLLLRPSLYAQTEIIVETDSV